MLAVAFRLFKTDCLVSLGRLFKEIFFVAYSPSLRGANLDDFILFGKEAAIF
jgi:hypothetical protein